MSWLKRLTNVGIRDKYKFLKYDLNKNKIKYHILQYIILHYYYAVIEIENINV